MDCQLSIEMLNKMSRKPLYDEGSWHTQTLLTKVREKINTVFWGDSHVNQLSIVINKIGENKNIGIYEMSAPGCAPIINVERLDKPGQDCKKKQIKFFKLFYKIRNLKM